jgi:hypothetical protein
MANIIIDTTLKYWQQGRRIKRAGSGWLSGNAVCCHHNGQTQDRRGRGGIIVADSKINYSCFNCGFKTGYIIGQTLTQKYRQLLKWLDVDTVEINRLTLEAIRIKDEVGDTVSRNIKTPIASDIMFKQSSMPPDSVPIDAENPKHSAYVDYLRNRGLSPGSYRYFVTPNDEGRNSNRIIIPYYYRGILVGNTSRFLDDRKPKYVSEQQRGYVFNIDSQQPDWNKCILVEGQFDAISIGGCAYMGQNILDEQAQILSKLYRQVIVVPDRDETGMSVCDRALDLGYQVSIPTWHSDIKDVNDAVKRYGRLATLLSIIQSATSSKIKVEMLKRRYK